MLFFRCDDLPIVFTHLIKKSDEKGDIYSLSCNNTEDRVTVPFAPEQLCMLPESARVYHPANDRVGGIGLVKSKLAIELSQYFEYDQIDAESVTSSPTRFTWNGVTYILTNKLLEKASKSRLNK